MNATTLPILDLARYADPADKAAFLADLRHAARPSRDGGEGQ